MSARADGTSAAAAKRRIEEGLEALRAGFAPYVEKHMCDRHGAEWRQYASRAARETAGALDTQALLKTLLANWNDLFQHDEHLRKARSFVYLALDARNAAAHFAGEMEARAALRYLDAMRELLAAIGAVGQEAALAALYDAQLAADGGPEPSSRGLGLEEPPPSQPLRREVCEPHTDALTAHGKYAPLYRYLSARSGVEWRASFDEVEAILGFRLPNSARLYRPWWSNQRKSSGHSHALAWQAAGWRTSAVDLKAKTLVFRRMEGAAEGAGNRSRGGDSKSMKF